MRALILEDDPISATAAEALLTRLGYAVTKRQCVSASRGAHLVEGPFDLYLVDVNVPETAVSQRKGSGLHFARWLRYQLSSVRIIVWSADDHSIDAARIGVLFVFKSGPVMSELERAVRGV